MNKKVLMIHEIEPWMLNQKLENYILTFDDGLYSQYYYLDFFKQLNTQKYFFISTGIICPEEINQNLDFPCCRTSHKRFFENGDTSNYMKWSQILEIYNTENCFIGGHSHEHLKNTELSIKELHSVLKNDSLKMIESFKSKNIDINSFCFPFNIDHILYKEILKSLGVNQFFGKERISIESLKEEFKNGPKMKVL